MNLRITQPRNGTMNDRAAQNVARAEHFVAKTELLTRLNTGHYFAPQIALQIGQRLEYGLALETRCLA